MCDEHQVETSISPHGQVTYKVVLKHSDAIIDISTRFTMGEPAQQQQQSQAKARYSGHLYEQEQQRVSDR